MPEGRCLNMMVSNERKKAMKKVICALLAINMCFSLCACGKKCYACSAKATEEYQGKNYCEKHMDEIVALNRQIWKNAMKARGY